MIFFRRSMATDNRARATMTWRKSSESCPEALMNAATSQADNNTRVSCTVTVVMERPRTGGVAINCSQIFSSKLSTSTVPSVGIFDSEAGTDSLEAPAEAVFAACFPAGATGAGGFGDGAAIAGAGAGATGRAEGVRVAGDLGVS